VLRYRVNRTRAGQTHARTDGRTDTDTYSRTKNPKTLCFYRICCDGRKHKNLKNQIGFISYAQNQYKLAFYVCNIIGTVFRLPFKDWLLSDSMVDNSGHLARDFWKYNDAENKLLIPEERSTLYMKSLQFYSKGDRKYGRLFPTCWSNSTTAAAGSERDWWWSIMRH